MSMVGASQDDEVMAEINITPFTDVLLVLLIIFMILAALVTPPGFQKKLPDSNDNAPQTHKNDKDKTVEVVVSKGGVIFVDGQESKGDAIYNDLQNVESHRGKDTHIALTADIKAPYGLVIKVLDAAKAAGLNDVAFVTS